MNDFQLSNHAQKVIIERDIKKGWIVDTFTNPDNIESDQKNINLEHRLKIITENDNRVLRMVCNIKVKPTLIVTVFFDRRMKGKLK
jgi:hypothetical protein